MTSTAPLELAYTPDAAERVANMVEPEQASCPFPEV
jgi:hypothetical protein